MKSRIQITIETEVGQHVEEIACSERHGHQLESIGLTLAESKTLLAAIQKIFVEQQLAEYLEARRGCPECGKPRRQKGSHTVTLQTLFGNLHIDSPRWNHCLCQPNVAKTFSPVAELLSERVSPERLYLETKWGSLIYTRGKGCLSPAFYALLRLARCTTDSPHRIAKTIRSCSCSALHEHESLLYPFVDAVAITAEKLVKQAGGRIRSKR